MFAGKHLCWNYFLVELQAWRSAILLHKKRLLHMSFLANIAKFLRAPILKKKSEKDCFGTGYHKVSNDYSASLVIQKHNKGWFLDLVRVYSLLIISINHSNTFLLPDLQKNRSKAKYCSKSHLFWYHAYYVMLLTGLGRLLSTT